MKGGAVATQWHQCDLPRAVAPAEGGSYGPGESSPRPEMGSSQLLSLILEGTEHSFPDGQVLIGCKKL